MSNQGDVYKESRDVAMRLLKRIDFLLGEENSDLQFRNRLHKMGAFVETKWKRG